MTTEVHVNLRSYREAGDTHRHDFVQVVLPWRGRFDIEVDGRQRRLDAGLGAFIEPGAGHRQGSHEDNASVILDLPPSRIPAELHERLARQRFVPIDTRAARLVDYMGLTLRQASPSPDNTGLWLALLLDTLASVAPGPASRLQRLLACIQAEPGLPWTTEAMAQRAAMSVSALHQRFQAELGTTPRAWLAQARLAHARELLSRTALPIAEIAGRCGYADQSALTRAMRRAGHPPPGAYRRVSLQSRSNSL